MYIWFLICVVGAIATIGVHFLSVEHLKLQKRYSVEKGKKIGDVLGIISGWGFFLFWMGIWGSPQPRFSILVLSHVSISVPFVDFSIPLLHLIVSLALLIPGSWIAIKGVKEITLKVAETHRTQKIVTGGVYSMVRHPQYLGGLLAHIGISFLLSALYSLLSTPLMLALIYLISRKEEKELIREFSREYEDYKKKVLMLIPKR